MVLQSLAATLLIAQVLIVNVATGPVVEPDVSASTAQEKQSAAQPLVRAATICIAKYVRADPRFDTQPVALGDLILAAVPPCVYQVRAMIAAYDRYFGEGAGETFFLGPYLDLLPTEIRKTISDQRP